MSKPPKYQHPKIFGFESYKDWIGKAQRDLHRFNTAVDQIDRIDHIFNFCSSISQVIEWAFEQVVRDQPGWPTTTDLGTFRKWLQSHCQSVGKLETIYMAAKHPRLDAYRPGIDAGSASISGAVSAPKLSELAGFSKAMEGVTIDDVRHLIVGGFIVDTQISYSVENLYSATGKTKFYQAAKEALTIWSQFDPAKGETQMFTI